MAALVLMDLALAQESRRAAAHRIDSSAVAALPQSMKKHNKS
jgi:hypothetical protein